jgi:hypothetical protein
MQLYVNGVLRSSSLKLSGGVLHPINGAACVSLWCCVCFPGVSNGSVRVSPVVSLLFLLWCRVCIPGISSGASVSSVFWSFFPGFPVFPSVMCIPMVLLFAVCSQCFLSLCRGGFAVRSRWFCCVPGWFFCVPGGFLVFPVVLLCSRCFLSLADGGFSVCSLRFQS